MSDDATILDAMLAIRQRIKRAEPDLTISFDIVDKHTVEAHLWDGYDPIATGRYDIRDLAQRADHIADTFIEGYRVVKEGQSE